MNDNGFGNYLSQRRKQAGFTQNELAEKLGVTGKTVSRWEKGAAKPRADLFIRIAGLLDVPVDELLKAGENKLLTPISDMAGFSLTKKSAA